MLLLSHSFLLLDFICLHGFYSVAHYGNMTRAARQLNLDQSALSRQIAKLEERFNTKLFYRHKKGMALTPEGQILLESVQEILNKIQETDQRIREQGTQKLLRVGVATEIAPFILSRLQTYVFGHPQLKLDILPAWERGEEKDLWIAPTIRDPFLKRQSTLIQEPLMKLWVGLYASEAYQLQNKPIQSLDALKRHKLIGYSSTFLKVIPELDHFYGGLTPFLTAQSLPDGELFAKAAMGIIHKFEQKEAHRADLVPMLDASFPRPSVDVCLIYTKQKAYSSLFLDFQHYCFQKFREGE